MAQGTHTVVVCRFCCITKEKCSDEGSGICCGSRIDSPVVLKILLHDQGDVSQMKDQGFVVNPEFNL